MSKLNVYIDGTWLFKVVEGNVFDRFLAEPRFFNIRKLQVQVGHPHGKN